MVKFYVGMIQRGSITIEQVPARWREAVKVEMNVQ
jgi:hypothetical protein